MSLEVRCIDTSQQVIFFPTKLVIFSTKKLGTFYEKMCVPSVNMTNFALIGKNCKTFDITESKKETLFTAFFYIGCYCQQ
jgi:hypothetical protein